VQPDASKNIWRNPQEQGGGSLQAAGLSAFKWVLICTDLQALACTHIAQAAVRDKRSS
jgi:hypothetical protein